LLVSRANTRELLGGAAVVEATKGKILFSDKLYRITLYESIDRRYLVAFLRSPYARFQYECKATGTSGSMQNIGQDTLKNLVHPVPPSDEQRGIGQWVSRVNEVFSSMHAELSRSVEKLIEY